MELPPLPDDLPALRPPALPSDDLVGKLLVRPLRADAFPTKAARRAFSKRIVRSTPLLSPVSRHTRMEELFEEFPEKWRAFQDWDRYEGPFLLRVLTANIERSGVSVEEAERLAEGTLARFREPPGPFPPPRHSALATLPLREARRGLNRLLLGGMARRLGGTAALLKRLYEADQVGRVRWIGPKVVHYWQFGLSLSEEVSSHPAELKTELVEEAPCRAEVVQTETTRTDVARVARQFLRYHELIGARSEPVTDARVRRKMPGFALDIAMAAPPPLFPLLEVISGTEVVRWVTDREVFSERRTETEVRVVDRKVLSAPDPALVLFGKVLASW